MFCRQNFKEFENVRLFKKNFSNRIYYEYLIKAQKRYCYLYNPLRGKILHSNLFKHIGFVDMKFSMYNKIIHIEL